jgi:creatinine amidohydrolase/Fe(II)-dependent formamide hydrolase-like protein
LEDGEILTSLGASNKVMALEHSWKTELLDGSWNMVTGQLNVLHHDRVQTSVLKLANGLEMNTTLLSNIKRSNPARTLDQIGRM